MPIPPDIRAISWLKVLHSEQHLRPKFRSTTSRLDPFKTDIEDRYKNLPVIGGGLMEEVKTMGYVGAIATLRRYVRALKTAQHRMNKLTIRFLFMRLRQ